MSSHTNQLKHTAEFIDTHLGEALAARTAQLPHTIGLGPPDMVYFIRQSSGLFTITQEKKQGSFHYVSGVDCASPAAVAVYFQKCINAQEASSLGGMKKCEISEGIFCVYDAFSRSDIRVRLCIPGGLSVTVVAPRAAPLPVPPRSLIPPPPQAPSPSSAPAPGAPGAAPVGGPQPTATDAGSMPPATCECFALPDTHPNAARLWTDASFSSVLRSLQAVQSLAHLFPDELPHPLPLTLRMSPTPSTPAPTPVPVQAYPSEVPMSTEGHAAPPPSPVTAPPAGPAPEEAHIEEAVSVSSPHQLQDPAADAQLSPELPTPPPPPSSHPHSPEPAQAAPPPPLPPQAATVDEAHPTQQQQQREALQAQLRAIEAQLRQLDADSGIPGPATPTAPATPATPVTQAATPPRVTPALAVSVGSGPQPLPSRWFCTSFLEAPTPNLAVARAHVLRASVICNPVPLLSGEAALLRTLADGFEQGLRLGSEDTVGPARDAANNRLTTTVYRYFADQCRFAQAIDFFTALAARYPAHRSALMCPLGAAWACLGRTESALALVTEGLQELTDHQSLLLAQGRLLYARARALGNAGIQALPPPPQPPSWPTYMGQPHLGSRVLQERTTVSHPDLDRAVAVAQHACRAHPRSASPWLLLARTLIAQGKFELALLTLNGTPMPDAVHSMPPMASSPRVTRTPFALDGAEASDRALEETLMNMDIDERIASTAKDRAPLGAPPTPRTAEEAAAANATHEVASLTLTLPAASLRGHRKEAYGRGGARTALPLLCASPTMPVSSPTSRAGAADLLVQMTLLMGWEELLRLRSELFLMQQDVKDASAPAEAQPEGTANPPKKRISSAWLDALFHALFLDLKAFGVWADEAHQQSVWLTTPRASAVGPAPNSVAVPEGHSAATATATAIVTTAPTTTAVTSAAPAPPVVPGSAPSAEASPPLATAAATNATVTVTSPSESPAPESAAPEVPALAPANISVPAAEAGDTSAPDLVSAPRDGASPCPPLSPLATATPEPPAAPEAPKSEGPAPEAPAPAPSEAPSQVATPEGQHMEPKPQPPQEPPQQPAAAPQPDPQPAPAQPPVPVPAPVPVPVPVPMPAPGPVVPNTQAVSSVALPAPPPAVTREYSALVWRRRAALAERMQRISAAEHAYRRALFIDAYTNTYAAPVPSVSPPLPLLPNSGTPLAASCWMGLLRLYGAVGCLPQVRDRTSCWAALPAGAALPPAWSSPPLVSSLPQRQALECCLGLLRFVPLPVRGRSLRATPDSPRGMLSSLADRLRGSHAPLLPDPADSSEIVLAAEQMPGCVAVPLCSLVHRFGLQAVRSASEKALQFPGVVAPHAVTLLSQFYLRCVTWHVSGFDR
ncbi:putative Chs5-Arf1p-binding protein BUD7/BCH1 [Paratrimastix pyriformis]|uniref:Chs5-Arf1p-binding protein BUD7/BCH1 n=1 Tax=Paratrimastix pyriformis TaxID=342808 RepID=A0ABQ8UGX9_9EUKA|nr:putative Chs5-Arf1p-binding protein BUD7/BCH1 [Paratrimastix pyriformis]